MSNHMKNHLLLILILGLTLGVAGSILAASIVPPSRTASANCSSCHSSYYISVEITDLSVPGTITNGGSEDVTMTVTVRSSGKSSYYDFSMTARLVSVNSKLQASNQQSDSGQRPSGSTAPYTWSKTYTFTLTGTSTGSDTLRGEATMDPVHRSPAVTDTVTRTIDVLSTNSPPQLSNGAVNPYQGDDMTDFRYSVTYRDPDGTSPLFVNVVIDGTDARPMSMVQTGDVTAGAEFYLEGILLSPGPHSFHFTASDGEASVHLPDAGTISGPEVDQSNRAPVLKDGKVSPAAGIPDQNFTYTVVYEDPDDHPPSDGVICHIDGVTHPEPIELDTDAPWSLKDGSFVNGERYSISLELGPGEHNFSFFASDGHLEVSLGPMNGPLVSLEPSMSAHISQPEDGSVFSKGEEITFSSEVISNVDLTDAQYLWTSNISGVLSRLDEFTADLPVGMHMISLEVYSDLHGVDSGHSIAISVIEIPQPTLAILGKEPRYDPVIDEMEDMEFSVDVRSQGGIVYGILWLLDGEVVSTGKTNHTMSTSYDGSGTYLVEAVITLDGEEWGRVTWNLTVRDVPAPIYITDPEWPPEMAYRAGDIVVIVLPCRDPLDRAFEVEWAIEGIPVSTEGLEISFRAGERPFGRIGRHSGTAVVNNPDGAFIIMDFEYSITGELPKNEIIPPPPQVPEAGASGLGDPSEDWPGYSIVIIFSIAIIMKGVSAVMALIPKKAIMDDAEVME